MKLPEPYIEELAHEILGQDTLPLISYLKDRENVSEFKIAEKLNITINQVRNILYRLDELNLVASTRKKDKKKGWYIYFWTFDTVKVQNLLIGQKRKKIEILRNMLIAEEKDTFYICPDGCTRFDTATAMEHEFKCTECNTLLKEENREKKTQQLRDQIKKIGGELDELLQIQEKKGVVTVKPPKGKKKTRQQIRIHKEPTKLKKQGIQKREKTVIEVKERHMSLLRRVKRRLFRH